MANRGRHLRSAAMTTSPVIAVLEDERAQLLVLRAALKEIGSIQEFADPETALHFFKNHVVDVAIVDIHLPGHAFDGLGFLKRVRSFDSELSVIIRTGDASAELADGAIEVRAFRRALKGKTSIGELRDLTRDAVEETRRRRQAAMDAAKTESVKMQWAQSLGSYEEATAISSGYKAIMHGIQNRITALAAMAEVMGVTAANGATELLDAYVKRNKAMAEQLVGEVRSFLDGPLAAGACPTDGPMRCTVNGVLEVLRQHFNSEPAHSACPLNVLGLSQDMYVAARSVSLLIALRHLVEFCSSRSAPDARFRLSAHYVERAGAVIEALPGPVLVLRKPSLLAATIFISFRLSGALVDTTLNDIGRALRDYPEDPHRANLQMIPLALAQELAAITIVQTRELTCFDLYVPLAT
jgi:DNA-binding NarL/FixJ family response regulator